VIVAIGFGGEADEPSGVESILLEVAGSGNISRRTDEACGN
jgi:hypothetical protein